MARMRRRTSQQLEAEARIRAHIEAYMTHRGINKTEMARRLGVSDSNLGRQLKSARGMSVDFLLRVRKVTSTPADILLDEMPDPKRYMVPRILVGPRQ